MPKRKDIHKIMVIGSGPIIIGQAAEFDYSGTQACLALREEGYEVVLVNSNPATIMTDTTIADKVYIEPLTVESISRIIRQEYPDAILPTLGGQVGLNMALALAKTGILDELHIELLGTKLDSIEQAEDREKFKELCKKLGEPVPPSKTVNTVKDALAFGDEIGYPIIVRPAFTMGGTGGGICHNREELAEIAKNGLELSPVTECLIEKSIAGYKEIEFEVMRDHDDNAMIVCCMENFDPVGIHTGDSIVFSPSQTLSDKEYQMLRDCSLRLIRALKIEGGCNVQLALDPKSFNYDVIEVNPRVSRSSALASKATGYPIAKMAAKIAVGMTLDEIKNPITGTTYAEFEPALDYVVCKIPRWDLGKFHGVSRKLGSSMKSVGEVMSIGRSFEEAIQKGLRMIGQGAHGFVGNKELKVDENGHVTAIVFKKCLRTIDPETKRFSPVYDENETMELKADHVVFGDADRLGPDIIGLVIVLIDRDIQAVSGDFQLFGQELPSPGNDLFLEIILEAEVAQHFKEAAMACGNADALNIRGTDALLAGGNTVAGRFFLAKEPLFHGCHTAVDKQQAGVIFGHQREAAKAQMAFAFKIVQVFFA